MLLILESVPTSDLAEAHENSPNSGHTSAADALSSWTVVLNDGASSTLDSEDAGHLEDDV